MTRMTDVGAHPNFVLKKGFMGKDVASVISTEAFVWLLLFKKIQSEANLWYVDSQETNLDF